MANLVLSGRKFGLSRKISGRKAPFNGVTVDRSSRAASVFFMQSPDTGHGGQLVLGLQEHQPPIFGVQLDPNASGTSVNLIPLTRDSDSVDAGRITCFYGPSKKMCLHRTDRRAREESLNGLVANEATRHELILKRWSKKQ